MWFQVDGGCSLDLHGRRNTSVGYAFYSFHNNCKSRIQMMAAVLSQIEKYTPKNVLLN